MFDKGIHFIDKEVMMKNLLDIKMVYDSHSIPFFFIFGTLLGAIREGDFITHDNDVDLGAYWEDRDRIIEANKELSNFNIETHISPYDINYIKDNEKIEVWLFEDFGSKRIYDHKRCSNIKYDSLTLNKLETIKFKGYEFDVPRNPKEFLEITYGKNWITPDVNGAYIL